MFEWFWTWKWRTTTVQTTEHDQSQNSFHASCTTSTMSTWQRTGYNGSEPKLQQKINSQLLSLWYGTIQHHIFFAVFQGKHKFKNGLPYFISYNISYARINFSAKCCLVPCLAKTTCSEFQNGSVQGIDRNTRFHTPVARNEVSKSFETKAKRKHRKRTGGTKQEGPWPPPRSKSPLKKRVRFRVEN